MCTACKTKKPNERAKIARTPENIVEVRAWTGAVSSPRSVLQHHTPLLFGFLDRMTRQISRTDLIYIEYDDNRVKRYSSSFSRHFSQDTFLRSPWLFPPMMGGGRDTTLTPTKSFKTSCSLAVEEELKETPFMKKSWEFLSGFAGRRDSWSHVYHRGLSRPTFGRLKLKHLKTKTLRYMYWKRMHCNFLYFVHGFFFIEFTPKIRDSSIMPCTRAV